MIIINNANHTKYTIEKVINVLVFLKLYIVFSCTKILMNFQELF